MSKYPLHLPPIYPSKTSPADFPLLWAKVSSYVDRGDWQLINAMLAGTGGVSFIIDHAIHSTAEHIRRNGLVPVVDTARFLKYLSQRSFTVPSAEIAGTASDVAGRNAGAREQVAHRTDESTGIGKDAPGGRSKGSRKARGEGKTGG